ncbi:MAG: MaoC/PaaZ C-terminal domain-containing protein [Flavobacteriales bacterium]
MTLQNIDDFAELSGDKFYAHTDENAPTAPSSPAGWLHGHYISAARGRPFGWTLSRDPCLNYGIEEARFTKPVYPGATIQVRHREREGGPGEEAWRPTTCR